jgi:hypothetical protein
LFLTIGLNVFYVFAKGTKVSIIVWQLLHFNQPKTTHIHAFLI